MEKRSNRLIVVMSTLGGAALLLGAFVLVWLVPRGPEASVAQTKPAASELQQENQALKGVLAQTASGTAVAGSTKAGEASMSGIPLSEQPHISVRGTGVISAKPDMANLQVGVSIQNPSLDAAQAEAATKMDAVTKEVKAAGVEDKDITTAQYNVEPVMDYRPNQSPTVTGFRVTNIVNVKLHDLTKAGKLIDDIVKSGANTIYGLSFGFSDPSALTKQAREAAMKDAQDKASQLAGLSGTTLGAPLTIDDGGANVPPPVMDAMANSAATGKASAPQTPINPGQQEVRVDLSVVYGIK